MDACSLYGRRGHRANVKTVTVGSTCDRHSVLQSGQQRAPNGSETPIPNTEIFSQAVDSVELASTPVTQQDHQQKIQGNSPVDSSLRSELLAKFQKITGTDEEFVPANEFNEVFTTDAIRRELEKHGMQTLFSFVIQRARTFFAILLAIRRLDALHYLVEKDLGDDFLPLTSSAFLSQEGDKAHSLLALFGGDTKKEFFEIQWTLLTPVLNQGEHLVLNDAARLPIIDTEPIAKGAYGGVHRIKIHPDSLNLEGSKSSAYALKLFSRGTKDVNKQVFGQELTALKSVCSSGHDHIIKLLASFERGGHYFMLFPLAKENLREFWAREKPFSVESHWLLEQMSGIASALSHIHNDVVNQDSRPMVGYHFDLKPTNILVEAEVSSGPGRWVISDFSNSYFQSKGTEQDLPSHPGTGTYEPPECQLDLPQSRAYDIWSLGCVFMECLAWAIRGPSAIDSFADDRLQDMRISRSSLIDDCFFTLEYDKMLIPTRAVTRAAVTRWIDHLEGDPNCSKAMTRLLHLVQRNLLQVDQTKRLTAKHLSKRLAEIVASDFNSDVLPEPQSMTHEESESRVMELKD
ncbi:MAG: hypothetical protein Q9167_007979 [Letrouitia subvulpina]